MSKNVTKEQKRALKAVAQEVVPDECKKNLVKRALSELRPDKVVTNMGKGAYETGKEYVQVAKKHPYEVAITGLVGVTVGRLLDIL